MIHLVQIGNGSSRRVAVVEEPRLRCLAEVQNCLRTGARISGERRQTERAGACARAGRDAGLRRGLCRAPQSGVCWRPSMCPESLRV